LPQKFGLSQEAPRKSFSLNLSIIYN
jgi:hypothetical protein